MPSVVNESISANKKIPEHRKKFSSQLSQVKISECETSVIYNSMYTNSLEYASSLFYRLTNIL